MPNHDIDAVDRRVLEILSTQGRLSMRELARQIGFSAPSTSERVKRLEDEGVIEGYSAEINPKAMGLALSVYIRLRPMPGEVARVAKLLAASPEIVESDRVTGDDCFVAKAHLRDVDELETLIDRFLPYANTNTAVIQSSPVKRRRPQLNESPRL